MADKYAAYSRRTADAQAAIFGAKPATDRPDDESHNWLRDKCRDYLNRLPGVCVWNNDATPRHGTPGTSDLIGWRARVVFEPATDPLLEPPVTVAQFLAIEIKRRRDTPREKQSGFLREVNAAGGIGLVVRDKLADLEKQWHERTAGIRRQKGE